MQITLDLDHVELLVAVGQGRVHSDPRYTRPDFEKQPDPPFGQRRAGRRLAPLKAARLVRLAEDADQYGVRLYELTPHGEEVLAEVRRQEAAANADAAATAVIGTGDPTAPAGA